MWDDAGAVFSSSSKTSDCLGYAPALIPLEGLNISDDAKRRPLRRFKELIEREITYFDDAKRQRSKTIELDKPNPEKLTIDKGGDFEVMCYPYSNTEYVFMRVKDRIELFDLDNFIRLISRLLGRMKGYRQRLRHGVKRHDRFSCPFEKAVEFGIRRLFGAQSGKSKEHILQYLMYRHGLTREAAEQAYDVHRQKHRDD